MSVNSNTREKRDLYKSYIENYLSVMIRAPFGPLLILEPFAGVGIEGGEKGSALIAAECIQRFSIDNPTKEFFLVLNEKDEKRCQELKANLSEYENFTRIYQGEAQQFISNATGLLNDPKHNGSHGLVFIDPYGYTQYSQQNIHDLLNLKRVDYLIFMPTIDIYRFKNKINNPARKFVLDMGVDESTLNDTNNINAFAESLVSCLKRISQSKYVYSYLLENRKDRNRKHHLFFITKNILGAEKFLEARKKIKKISEPSFLFAFEDTEAKKIVSNALNNEITNVTLYEKGIENGFLPVDINPILKQMEQDEEITINCNFNRRRGAFYLKDKGKIIYIQKVKK